MKHNIAALTDVVRSDVKGSGLRHFTLNIVRGEVLGLFGHRYCGKASFFRMLTGEAVPEEGTVQFFDASDRDIPRPEDYPAAMLLDREALLIDEFTVWENLLMMRSRKKWRNLISIGQRDRKRLQVVLLDFHLDIALEKKACELTVMQRLMVSALAARMQGVQILMIDGSEIEGIDQEFEQLAELFGRLTEDGMTVICFSPRIRAMTLLCDRIAFLHNGRVIKLIGRDPLYNRNVNRILQTLYQTEETPYQAREGDVTLTLEVPSANGLDAISLRVRRGGILVAESADPSLFARTELVCSPESGFTAVNLAEIDHIQVEMTPSENLCMGLYSRLSDAGVIRRDRVEHLRNSFLDWYGEEFDWNRSHSRHLMRKERTALNLYRYYLLRPECLVLYDLYLHNDPIVHSFVRRALTDFMEEGVSVILITSNAGYWKDLSGHRIVV